MKLSTVRLVGEAWMPHTFSSSSSRDTVSSERSRRSFSTSSS
jgi:hypothetical protein